MKLIVGLGNPGDNFSSTKHNFGYWVIDNLVEQRSLKYKAGKGEYIIAKDSQCMLIKPTTFMNDSGIAIKQVFSYYDIITINELIVIYDDIDLHLGDIRFKPSGSDGGHNGIKSIIYHLKSDRFDRLKIGIALDVNMRPSENYVLKPFPKQYENLKNEVVNHASDGIDFYLEHGINKSMNNFNKRNNDNGK
jgi:PTH1 family peptidyl-tRNA hydrolase